MESLAIGQVEDGRVGDVEVIVVTMSDCMTVADALPTGLGAVKGCGTSAKNQMFEDMDG